MTQHVDIHALLLKEYHDKLNTLLIQALKANGIDSPSPELAGRLTRTWQQGIESWYLDGKLLLTTCPIGTVW